MKTIQLMLLITLFSIVSASFATIFYSKNEAMELAFGKDTPVASSSLFPDDSESAKIQELARTKLESGLFTFYVGKEQQKILGYAAIETSTVRTKPETLMIVLTPEGELRNVYTLAFHEPPEYLPPQRWYDTLIKRPLAEMDFNKGVDGISGATLSTRSALTSIRKVMAVYQVMIKNKGGN
ncbi:MAG: FMN-binding protein [Methylovulum sp.]|nr:FMN-binding protein [Methylovulum sp.]